MMPKPAKGFMLKGLPFHQREAIIRLLTSNHHFPIETGRWDHTPQNERLCEWCEGLSDEEHALYSCPAYFLHRQTLVESLPKELLLLHDNNIAKIFMIVLNSLSPRIEVYDKALWNYGNFVFHVLKDARGVFLIPSNCFLFNGV